MIRCLLANGPDTTIVEASKNGHIDIVKTLIEKGVDINTKDDYGYTSLSYAALKGHSEVVDLLIEYGADMNVTIHGDSLVVYATKNGYDDLVDHLINNGANYRCTKSRNSTEKTPSRFKKWRSKLRNGD